MTQFNKIKAFNSIQLLLLVSHSVCQDMHLNHWENFKEQFNKEYVERDEVIKHIIFKYNLQEIQEHNEDYKKGLISYKLGINNFTDRLPNDMKELLNGYKPHLRKDKPTISAFDKGLDPNIELPENLDWRNKTVNGAKVVSPVIDQGMCASCYAISGAGALEGQMSLKHGYSTALSVQNIIDCSNKYGNFGCSGGLPDFTYNYIKGNGGINSADYYPYTGEEGQCYYNRRYKAGIVKEWVGLPKGDEYSLKKAVALEGPISVAIDASRWTFQMYAGGIYDDPECKKDDPDHAVLLVGYGVQNGKDYWLIKNSWGVSWGEKGYIRIHRNADNQCGIASHANYPLVQ